MPLITVAESVQCLSVGQSQLNLSRFQYLDVRFLIHTHHYGILRGMQVQTHNIGGFAGKLGIGREALCAES